MAYDKHKRLDEVARRISECKKCGLWRSRRNPVPGEGDPDAQIMFIGEAPGYQEDVQGRPFVGAAGKLLNTFIRDFLGLDREDVFITNIIKCRPPKNRDPRPEEVRACSPFLDEQISIIRPRIIVCLGRHSARYILSNAGVGFRSILSVRGRIYNCTIQGVDVKVIATIHPAAALYRPPWRRFLEEDFGKIKMLLSGRDKVTLEDFI